MVKRYVAERGAIVWLDFDPSSGTEMRGRHMALVISNRVLQAHTGRAIVCPITSTIKANRKLDVILPADVTGRECSVLPDQIKSIDCEARRLKLVAACPDKYLADVITRVNLLISAKV